MGNPEIDEYMLSLLVSFNIPYICLSVWKDPALLELAYELIKLMVEAEPEEVLHLFVESKESILSLFDLLNIDSSTEALVEVVDVRRFLASTMGKLAENGMLAQAVQKFEVRSSAIAALASACLSEGQRPSDEDEELTSNRLASGLMQCLVELCAASHSGGEAKTIQLSPAEAESIARSLGKKICHMVISRFLERAKLQQYEIEEDENVMDAPDVAMLCAVAQHEKALQIIRSIGGLHALAQIASEGELSAMDALQQGCQGDASLLLEADTYIAIMSLFSADKEHASWISTPTKRARVEASALQLLTQLCNGSTKGCRAVASGPGFQSVFVRAAGVVASAITETVTDADCCVGKKLDEKDGQITDAEDCKEGEDSDVSQAEGHEEQSDANEVASSDSNMADNKPLVTVDVRDENLLMSSFSFLSALVHIPKVRNDLWQNSSFIHAVTALIAEENSPNLQFEATRVVSQLAPYSADGSLLTPGLVGDMLSAAFAIELCQNQWKTNSMHVHAAKGIQFVFESLCREKQMALLKEAGQKYCKVLKSYSLSRHSSKESEKANGGEVAFHMATLMTTAQGKVGLEDFFGYELVVQLANTVQWRCDPKTVISQHEMPFWDGTTTLCLQLLAQCLWRERTKLKKMGIEPLDLKKNVVMVARPGKAPRKAIDFVSALDVTMKTGEAVAKLAAKRIETCLNMDL